MRGLTGVVAAAVALLLTGFTDADPPPKPQPGSWSMKMDVVDAQGPGADKIRTAMAPMTAAISQMSVCITPEESAKVDPIKNIASGNGDCTFDKQDISAAGVHVAGTCVRNGVPSKVAADGTISATEQDLTITVEGPSPMGGGPLTVKMRMQTQRTGECKPGDMKARAGAM